MIAKSGEVFPLPPPVGGSLLVIPVSEHTGFGSQVSLTTTETLTATNLWFGGQSVLGLADTDEVTGGVVSWTLTTELELFELPDASVTLHENGSVPSGKVDPDGGTHTGEPRPGQLSATTGFKVTRRTRAFDDRRRARGTRRLLVDDDHVCRAGVRRRLRLGDGERDRGRPFRVWPWRRLAERYRIAVRIFRAIINRRGRRRAQVRIGGHSRVLALRDGLAAGQTRVADRLAVLRGLAEIVGRDQRNVVAEIEATRCTDSRLTEEGIESRP